MESLYFSVNSNPKHLIAGNLLQFYLLATIGLIFGIVFYLGSTNPAFRKPALRNYRLLSKWQGIILGGGVVLLIIGMAYASNWTRFYQIDVQHDQMALHYFLPQRILSLSWSMVERLEPEAENLGRLEHLAIRTKDGKIYRSAGMYPLKCQAQFQRLKDVFRTGN